MSYYLPIKVNNRRLHVCHLMTQRERERAEMSREVPWGFIVLTERSNELLHLLSDEPKLIDEGGEHISLDGQWGFVVKAQDENNNNYIVELINNKKQSTRKDVAVRTRNLVVQGRVGDGQNLTLSVDNTDLDYSQPINVTIEYNHKVSEGVIQTFSDSITFYLCDSDDSIASVALDFGSEASQVRFLSNDDNTALVDVFNNILEGREKGQEMPKNSYWQGKSGDFLFKSVFWVNYKPQTPTNFGDFPQDINKGPFIPPLVPDDMKSNSYDSLCLLPNLKLVELSQGGGCITYKPEDIRFVKGSEIDYNQPNLADHQMRNSVLHIILSNFLHAIMSRVNTGQSDKFVHLVLMAPNVYYQDKVFDMMRWIYSDFELIKKSYPICKGIEVQVVSESDAAFIGAKTEGRIQDAANGIFLNIDSGKGTTDFSIIQQCTSSNNRFVSLYRDGIPAAGNVLTYAYYEALYDFIKKKTNKEIHKFFTDDGAARSRETIKFLNNLETFKMFDSRDRYRDRDRDCEQFTIDADAAKSLEDLNKCLQANIKIGNWIPFIRSYVKEKVAILVKCLEESIGHYMEMQECVFAKVILSGRAFMCPIYREEVEKMLKERNWMVREDEVVWNETSAKLGCMKGALAIGRLERDRNIGNFDVNFNSGLIGSPLLTDCCPGVLNRLWEEKISRIFKRRNLIKKEPSYTKQVKVNELFFAEGSAKISTHTLRLRLGGRSIDINSDTCTEKKIFFLGDKFALQDDGGRLRPIPSQDLSFTNDLYAVLVRQSLFPYYKGSVGSPIGAFFKDEYNFSDSITNDVGEKEIGKSDNDVTTDVKDDKDNTSPDYDKDNE